MTGSKSRTAAKKAPAKKAAPRKMSKASIARIDNAIEQSRGTPGFEMVRALGELAKLGPFKIKRPFNVKAK